MILDIDVGNTCTKWRLQNDATVLLAGSQPTESILAGDQFELPGVTHLTLIRVASVASPNVIAKLNDQMMDRFSLNLHLAEVTRCAGGVTCAYDDLASFGVDRWLAMVAAYQQTEQSVLVLDAGTAITMDLIDSSGKHLGGFIMPGLKLMTECLRQGTNNIRANIACASDVLLPAARSIDAVNRGCLLAVVATLERLTTQFCSDLILTGGNSEILKDTLGMLGISVYHNPYLVIDGLSIGDIKLVNINH